MLNHPPSRLTLLESLQAYSPTDPHERQMLEAMRQFVAQHEDCFLRSILSGQVTGSAWITDPARQRALLVFHRKLEKWLQPGGHSDGNPDILAVALTEAQEETGLQSVRPVNGEIFDIDVHTIPERKGVPEHQHYDVRFWFEADPNEPLTISHESLDLRWVSLADIASLNADESLLRLVRKTPTGNS